MEQENAVQEVENNSLNWKIKIILIAIAAVSFFFLSTIASDASH